MKETVSTDYASWYSEVFKPQLCSTLRQGEDTKKRRRKKTC